MLIMDKRLEGLTREDLMAAIEAMDKREAAIAAEAEAAKERELEDARLEVISAGVTYLTKAGILSDEEVAKMDVNAILKIMKEAEEYATGSKRFSPLGMFGVPKIKMRVNGHEPTKEDMDIIEKFVRGL
jgi:hypothetical protein